MSGKDYPPVLTYCPWLELLGLQIRFGPRTKCLSYVHGKCYATRGSPHPPHKECPDCIGQEYHPQTKEE